LNRIKTCVNLFQKSKKVMLTVFPKFDYK